MKCPMLFNIVQKTTEKQISNSLNEAEGRECMFVERQLFADCCEEECMAYDKETKKCKKIGEK